MIKQNNGELFQVCDYCGDVAPVHKQYKYRKKSLIDKDACRKCLGLKLREAKAVAHAVYVESIIDRSSSPYKGIPLTQGKVAVVDDKNYEYLLRLCKWSYTSQGYAVGYIVQEDGSLKQVPMHRVIMGFPPDHLEVSHRNGDTLLNIEENLIVSQRNQNARNIKPFENKSSIYKGVSFHKAREVWEVRIGYEGRKLRIGTFTNELAAANAYNHYASLLYGEYAYLNEVAFMKKEEWDSFNTGKTARFLLGMER